MIPKPTNFKRSLSASEYESSIQEPSKSKVRCYNRDVFIQDCAESDLLPIFVDLEKKGNEDVRQFMLARKVMYMSTPKAKKFLLEGGKSLTGLVQEVDQLIHSLYVAKAVLLSSDDPVEEDTSHKTTVATLTRAKKNYIDKKLDVPASIGSLVDDILDIIKAAQYENCVLPDIMSVWSRATTAEAGTHIRTLLDAVVSSNVAVGLSLLQKIQSDTDGSSMTEKQFCDLKEYLIKSVFNGKKVGFKLDDISSLIDVQHVIEGKDKLIEGLPRKLRELVKRIFEQTFNNRILKEASINRRNFIEIISGGCFGKTSLDFMEVVVRKELNIKELNTIQEKLEKVVASNGSGQAHVDYKPLDGKSGHELIRKMNSLFFKRWLVCFNAYNLRKYFERYQDR